MILILLVNRLFNMNHKKKMLQVKIIQQILMESLIMMMNFMDMKKLVILDISIEVLWI
jgi:hypothetical protein